MMPGVTVKDVNQQPFVRALAAFLKKSRKLKVPEWMDTVKLAKHKELAPMIRTGSRHELLLQHGTCTGVVVQGLAP
ncbi:hypothetical protein ACRRTK_011723 [Alexandromys fortis]